MSRPASPHRVEELPLPTDRLGTRRSLTVHRFGTPGARPKVYVQAALHADETPGLLVAHHLIRRLRGLDIPGEIIVVPMANPTGIAQIVEGVHIGRYALDGAGNFNRDFPDLIDGAAERLKGRIGADREANVAAVREALRATLDALPPPKGEVPALRRALLGMAFDADIVLDLHCDLEAVPHLYAGDALWPDLADLSALLGVKAVLLSADSGGKPFDEACSVPWWTLAERFAADGPIPPACVATTVELRGKADVDDDRAAADAEALIGMLIRRGAVTGSAPGPLPDLPPLLCEATPLSGLARVVAPVSGVIAFHRAVGDRVEAGDPIADIVDPTAADPDNARTTLVAPGGGIVMARNNLRFASRGELVASIAGPAPLATGEHGLLFD
ncbi:succinylglutamate desuccinylase/aspartoacylase family protein [Azospirillum agricola]|uniref:succinylglutamate desuccinylase/aspartoacylase family protein n=1 Tax=Azospirillum agricola TaxID=1720247 RepID=UPI000A0EF2CA|nr:succinylglutamate desuccinylase/aspartoacylase family protein [Azospirillum agricola]SMH58738.1 hypothetical protein SAMN02982994_4738 [Azospirillum lipoferum]